MKTISDANLRWMVRRDLKDVLSIEAKCFGIPWDEEDFLQALRRSTCVGVVAEIDCSIAGYVVYDLEKKAARILNICVAPWYQRCGIGTAFINRIHKRCLKDARDRIIAECSEVNLGAQCFFRACGFVCAEVLEDHYIGGESAYRFILRREWKR